MMDVLHLQLLLYKYGTCVFSVAKALTQMHQRQHLKISVFIQFLIKLYLDNIFYTRNVAQSALQ